ncbi:hypothetical protein ANN_00291 [Periplaneta americana]|uniref:DUF4817 domain-containing protein n=1 Tax=Periplaneta americana TaxID=6978 RepID=A0ABQ8TQF0_PERAM|nr:hypothetical protein ANN_00291 [Periplaneta americana]
MNTCSLCAEVTLRSDIVRIIINGISKQKTDEEREWSIHPSLVGYPTSFHVTCCQTTQRTSSPNFLFLASHNATAIVTANINALDEQMFMFSSYCWKLFSTFCVNVKMQYTLNQRLFLVKQYWITNSITATQRAYQREFGVRNPPKRNTIQGLVNKLETTGSLVSEKGKHRSSRLPTVVVDVSSLLLCRVDCGLLPNLDSVDMWPLVVGGSALHHGLVVTRGTGALPRFVSFRRDFLVVGVQYRYGVVLGRGSISAWGDYLVGFFPRFSSTVRQISGLEMDRSRSERRGDPVREFRDPFRSVS